MSSEVGVFISSSLGEVADERRAIKTALDIFDRRLHAWLWEEEVPATSGDKEGIIRDTYLKEVENCQVYLGLFWQKCGPYTIEEYDLAEKLNKPRLIFVRQPQGDEKQSPELDAFLNRIAGVDEGTIIVEYFDITDGNYLDLAVRVVRALVPYQSMLTGWVQPMLPPR